jgi:hypothetical protein
LCRRYCSSNSGSLCGAQDEVNRREAISGCRMACGVNSKIGSSFLYKNNKPIRTGSFLTAPVIGHNPVIALAGNPGGPRIFGNSGVLFASNGTRLATLTPYPCRTDHCSGRVVSSASTSSLVQAAKRASGSSVGYVKVAGICVRIPHIGSCFGKVDKTRPLCNRVIT